MVEETDLKCGGGEGVTFTQMFKFINFLKISGVPRNQ